MQYQFLTRNNESIPKDTVYCILPPIKQSGKAIIGRAHYEVKLGIITLNDPKAQSETILQYNPKLLNLQNTLQLKVNPKISIYQSQFSGYEDMRSLLESIAENNNFYLRRNPTENKEYDIIKLTPKSNPYQLKNLLATELPNIKLNNLEIILQNTLINPEQKFEEYLNRCLQNITTERNITPDTKK